VVAADYHQLGTGDRVAQHLGFAGERVVRAGDHQARHGDLLEADRFAMDRPGLGGECQPVAAHGVGERSEAPRLGVDDRVGIVVLQRRDQCVRVEDPPIDPAELDRAATDAPERQFHDTRLDGRREQRDDRTHRVSGEADGAQTEDVEQLDEVARHARLPVEGRIVGLAGSTVAAGIGCDHAMAVVDERRHHAGRLPVEHAVGDEPVLQDHGVVGVLRTPLAVDDLDAVIGGEAVQRGPLLVARSVLRRAHGTA
jgi:hypothetical protein